MIFSWELILYFKPFSRENLFYMMNHLLWIIFILVRIDFTFQTIFYGWFSFQIILLGMLFILVVLQITFRCGSWFSRKYSSRLESALDLKPSSQSRAGSLKSLSSIMWNRNEYLFLYHIHVRQKWFCDIGCAKRWGDRQCGHCQKNWAPGKLVKNPLKPPSAVNYDCQQSLSEIFACVKSKILQPWGRSKWADDIPWW